MPTSVGHDMLPVKTLRHQNNFKTYMSAADGSVSNGCACEMLSEKPALSSRPARSNASAELRSKGLNQKAQRAQVQTARRRRYLVLRETLGRG